VTTDWLRWHDAYGAPSSSLSRRLEVVRREFRHALASADVRSAISMCAGDGRDVLPELAGSSVPALLVELDPTLAGRARSAAADLGLTSVTVRTEDAGSLESYRDTPPADVLLACGVFGNISVEDARRTVTALPVLLADDAVVIWTRGRGDDGPDAALGIRALFSGNGFTEVRYTSPADARFRVGVHRLTRRTGARPIRRLFSFA
jgi:hypothetical protein